ncbi:stage V sporulation protein AF [Ammoniphilus oxalaticus]|uniref:Stage V sporulation protein AF n=2 Tax=Ammoniphilus oxalaticus TaxID=66863 RepID=A0A419SP00_9BACL|nr:spore germination protein [Ammoniphilus oxalaticus]RKD26034.1 stage V sporulation protein AF [Ammoniphilus oxalaticus]
MKLFKKIELNKKIINDRIAATVSYDVKVREMNFGSKDVAFCYTNGLVDSSIMTSIMQVLPEVKREQLVPDTLKHFLETYFIHLSVEKVETFDEAIDSMLTGVVLVLIEDEEIGLLIDAREYPGRSPEEPDTERVVRGSRDGFVENILVNTALTRRRIRDERLRMEMTQVGSRSKTDVCLAYLDDVADPGMVELLKARIKKIKVDGLPMAEKTVEEFIVRRNWHPYPMVRYTERPDVAASHLLEGHVLVFVDTSPVAMITPTTFFHHVQHAEEYRQIPIVGAYIRWVRFIGIFTSLFVLPIWMFYALNKGYLPAPLAFIGPKETGEIPIFWQFIFAELGIDLMRLAAVHTPTPLATAMGLVAAVLIGDVAISVGLFMPETILYLAVAAIGMFATPSYELGLANRLARLALLATTFLFGIPGFMFGVTALIILLASTTSLNTPYLWPFIPFNWTAMKHVLIRPAIPSLKHRPSIVHPQDDNRI